MGLSGSLTGTDGVALISIGSCVGFCRVQGSIVLSGSLREQVESYGSHGGHWRFCYFVLVIVLNT